MTEKATPEDNLTGPLRYRGNTGDPFSSLRLFEAIKRRQTSLPTPTTPLVGRERELRSLLELVHRDTVRLITLTGPGGTGKTRLAMELALKLKDEFPGGVFFTSLAAIKEHALVASEIVSTLDIMEKAGQRIEDTLTEFLKGKRILLILDNFEQVIAAAPLVAELLRECPDLKIIITSRAPIRIRGEHEFPVLPLAVPDLGRIPVPDQLLLYAAVELFVQRTQAIRADFSVTASNARSIAEICARLDGLPLALELAAARARTLAPEELLIRLQNRLELLTEGPRDAPVRQQTLRNAVAWSYDLLEPRDKVLFGRLSVFAGDFSLDAAKEVCTTKEEAALEILDQLSRLVESSLLLGEHAGNEVRFRMLETIREFAHEALAKSGESLRVQERFANFFLSLAEEAASELTGPHQATMMARLDQEHDNLRAALRSLIENNNSNGSLRLASALWSFWNIRGYNTEGRVWLMKALEKAGPTRSDERARALIGAGGLAIWQNDFSAASLLLNEALNLSKELGDKECVAYALNYLANVADDLGDFTQARRMYEESLATFRALGNRWGEALVLNNLGVGARYQGDYAHATAFHQESLKLFTELGDKRRIAHSQINLASLLERKGEYEAARETADRSLSLFRELNGKIGIAESCLLLGIVARKQGNHEKGRKQLGESLIASREVGYREIIVNCLEELAALDYGEGHVERAARLLAVAEAMRKTIPFPIPPAYQADKEREVAIVRSALGEDRFQAQAEKGRLMTIEEAVLYALASEPPN